MVAKNTKEEMNMIEIKEITVPDGGYSLEDLIAAERENARLNLYYEQLHRLVNDEEYGLADKIRKLFDWRKPENPEE